MKLIIRYLALAIVVLNSTGPVLAQDNKLSAKEILQRAIDSSGGDRNLDSINSVDFIQQIVSPENDTISLAVKRKGFNKYCVSTLSVTHENSTTIYNNGKAVLIKNEVVQPITDPITLEELSLNCYISPNYGYKKLGYKLTRLDDQHFNNFDCYAILAESPLGNKILNYYDKKKGNLLMIVYPNEHRTVFVDFFKHQGITCPLTILTTDNKGSISKLFLKKIDYDDIKDTNWFNIPKEGDFKTPDIFKTGTFKYINSNEGATVIREKDTQVELSKGSQTDYKIKWTTSSDYLVFRLKNSTAPPTNENIEYIKCRIITWNENKYYCQYITSGNLGGTCAFEKTK